MSNAYLLNMHLNKTFILHIIDRQKYYHIDIKHFIHYYQDKKCISVSSSFDYLDVGIYFK